jgi:hypothetical protein
MKKHFFVLAPIKGQETPCHVTAKSLGTGTGAPMVVEDLGPCLPATSACPFHFDILCFGCHSDGLVLPKDGFNVPMSQCPNGNIPSSRELE